MELPISLRSAEKEQEYAESKLRGEVKDIAHIKATETVGNTKILRNFYEYDLVYNVNDMTLGNNGEEWMTWWVNVGIAIQEGKFNEYHQFIVNMPPSQSQPQVPHGHLVCFDADRVKLLRTLLTAWRENNDPPTI